MGALAKIPLRMSLDEFLGWDSGDELRYELVDGQPRAMAPASLVHGFLQNELGSLLRDHLRRRGSGCEVIANPGVMPQLASKHNFRIPDLAVTCSPVVAGEPALPAPVLIVEILSHSNQAATWANITAYRSIPSVQEIVVIRTDRIAAELLRRTPAGTWPEQAVSVEGDLVLESVGFRLPLAQLYERVRFSI